MRGSSWAENSDCPPSTAEAVGAARCRPLRTGSGGSTLAKTTFALDIMRRYLAGFFPSRHRAAGGLFRGRHAQARVAGPDAVRPSAGASRSWRRPPRAVSGPPPAGSFRQAALKASAAVVSINTSKAPERHPQANDPWFRFFFGDPGSAATGRPGQRRDHHAPTATSSPTTTWSRAPTISRSSSTTAARRAAR